MNDLIAILGSAGNLNKEPAIKLDVKPDGSLIMSLGSFNRPGLYSHFKIEEAHKMSERELLQAAGLAITSLADHQFRSYGDNHDIPKTMHAVIEAVHKIIKDGTPRVWVNKRHFQPFREGTVKTMDVPNPERPNWW